MPAAPGYLLTEGQGPPIFRGWDLGVVPVEIAPGPGGALGAD